VIRRVFPEAARAALRSLALATRAAPLVSPAGPRAIRAFALAACAALILAPAAWAAEPSPVPPAARDGHPWRVAYAQGGYYENYSRVLHAFVEALGRMGWVSLPEGYSSMRFADTRALWEWLGMNASGPYLEFVQDAFWDSGWDGSRRNALKAEAIARLRGKKDIDAVIAMGTWAGQDLANTRHHVPVLVFQSSSPVQAGIVKGAERSGIQNVFALCDPDRYKRQVRLFHGLTGFKRLGIVYENTPSGRIYAAVDDVYQAGSQLGAEVVECHAMTNIPDQAKAVGSYQECHERLAGQVDAMYLTHSKAVTPETLPGLLAPFQRAGIPTFAQMGSEAVRAGALMSMAQTDFGALGQFYARTLGKVLRGAKPGSLSQIFEDPPVIAVNLETAKIINYNPPNELLAAAELVYTTALPARP
jgi:ABC-type uncharacterized transport system substrate-binding protein